MQLLLTHLSLTTLSIKLGQVLVVLKSVAKTVADFAGATTSTLVIFSGTPPKLEKKEHEIKQQSEKNQRTRLLHFGKNIKAFVSSFIQQDLEKIIKVFSKKKKKALKVLHKGRPQIK